MVLRGCKWDPQVGDLATIASHSLLLGASTLAHLEAMASALAAETLAAEEELAARPELHLLLGVPRCLRRLWACRPPPPPERAHRLMRFDFHPTRQGWRLSEVNSDVPGGFAESSLLPALFQPLHPGTRVSGDPAGRWIDRVLAQSHRPEVVLVSAPGFMEDQQVVSFLTQAIESRGHRAIRARPEDLAWYDGRAVVRHGGEFIEVGAVVRFLQAEWLLPWPRPRGWRWFFQQSQTPVFNAGTALLTESKRFPLVWPQLRNVLPTWRALLPESRDPTHLRPGDDGWLLKGTFSNNGDAVVSPGGGANVRWRTAAREARRHPWRWILQRRFEPLAIDTPAGPRYPCLGVFTLGDEPVGLYGRLSAEMIVDHRASDAAVLIVEDAVDR
jgi:hypothetical protein